MQRHNLRAMSRSAMTAEVLSTAPGAWRAATSDIRTALHRLPMRQLVTDLFFQYRFQQGSGLEGHSFGNLFLTAVCAITNGHAVSAHC